MERVGLPVVVISALPPLALNVGAHRVVQGVRIEHLCGNPGLEPARDRALARRIVATALHALGTPVAEPTLFPVVDAA